ncbi:hypothetical protein [Pluralibacter gergoviae]|nr:hypothetical protein [Pluralibacter gergoviae]EKV6248775.1 hypothetical protein [Pluralibacter gergoviae]EKW9965755.1 hypothetical protein [Pluralibacter gergoviae]ELD4270958.1 hypothetical protein [Pluralibacter gergoviae]ELD4276713.1 hypothetical protein [Pluralibacter gergoviae]
MDWLFFVIGFNRRSKNSALIHWPGVRFIRPLETVPAGLYTLWYDEPLPDHLARFLQALRG